MAPIYGALALILVHFGAALLALVNIPSIQTLPDIAHLCNPSIFPDGFCQTHAMKVAAESLAAIVMVAIVALGLNRRTRGSRTTHIEPFEASSTLMLLLLTALTGVLVVHNFFHRAAELTDVRITPAEAPLISLENLAWPLLLQLTLWSRKLRWQSALIAFLAGLVVLSPFRDVIFAILYFGVLIPLATTLLTGNSHSAQARLAGFGAIAGLIMFTLLVVAYQTNSRLASAPTAALPESRVSSIMERLTSRALSPFFQAAAVRPLANRVALPGYIASIKQKFGIGVNLNQYIYRTLYYADQIGQTTTLYLGESVANTKMPTFFWEFSAPLALVVAYLLLRPVCDVGVLFAIALWRSSMSGLFDISTALVLQVGFCVALSYIKNRTRGRVAIAGYQPDMA